ARLPVKLGTAITVPYFRNPIDLAAAFATISELMSGREISLGLGPGSRSILTHHVERVKPLTIMAELATALRKLFNGEPIGRNERTAREHAKRFVSHTISGWPDETLEKKSIDPRAVHAVRQAYAENRGVDYAASLTPDEAVDRLIIAGTPRQCIERIAELFS